MHYHITSEVCKILIEASSRYQWSSLSLIYNLWNSNFSCKHWCSFNLKQKEDFWAPNLYLSVYLLSSVLLIYLLYSNLSVIVSSDYTCKISKFNLFLIKDMAVFSKFSSPRLVPRRLTYSFVHGSESMYEFCFYLLFPFFSLTRDLFVYF